MARVIFYIDGFNFYYGLKKKAKIDKSWRQFYWIDFVKLCEQFLGPDQTLEKVKYFSAAPLNSGKQSRQSALFKANILLNPDKFEVIRGRYYKKTQTCKHCGDVFEVPEEKRTDVNISVNLIGDCLLDNTDILVIITADSDLVPPIEFILNNFRDKKVRIYFPPHYSSYDLKHISPRKPVYLEYNKTRFRNSVMPDTVYNSDKTDSATIPLEWK
ncbi:MAG: NYN domain-containing protein [Bacteroidales bacterium]|nr:NYN domain-containing protein [Bacteroidales bacterium]